MPTFIMKATVTVEYRIDAPDADRSIEIADDRFAQVTPKWDVIELAESTK